MSVPGDIIEELGEEYYGNWLRIVSPKLDNEETEILIGIADVRSGPNVSIWVEHDIRARKMAADIAEFVRQHQADW